MTFGQTCTKFKPVRKLIGYVAVETGTICIGDPCYWREYTPEQWAKEIHKYLDSQQQNFSAIQPMGDGYAGGFLIPAGYGDSTYPVEIEVVEDEDSPGVKRVASIKITFIVPEHDVENEHEKEDIL